jgi:signal transduction histidine kinase
MLFRFLVISLALHAGTALACEEVVSLADADWRMQQGDDPAWAQPGFDDRHWRRLVRGQSVPAAETGSQDGFLWYRLHFHIKPEDLRQPCFILLGRIQESDEAYLNGVGIGGEGRLGSHWYQFVSAMRQPRSYALPPDLLQPGENLLAVRSFSLYLPSGLATDKVKLGPVLPILEETQALQRHTERIEVVTLTLLMLGVLITGFLSLSRQSERQHRMLFGFIVAVTTIYLVDSLLLYPLRLDAAWTKRLVLVAGPLIPLMLLKYLSVVSGERFARAYWWMALLPAACALPLLFNQPLDLVIRLYDVWFLSFVPIVLVLLLFMLRRARYRMRQSRLLVLAAAVVALGLVVGLAGEGTMTGELNPVELGILGMTVILMFAFARRLTREYEARLRLSAGVLSAQDEERRRIARELHDGLGQRLVAARLLLEAETLQRPGGQLQEVVRELRDTTRELRAIVHGLRPVELGEVSLRSALASYSQRVRELTGVHVQISHGHHGYLPSEVEEHLFRIFQEAVNNATRHGGARDVRIVLSGTGQQLNVSITDDGVGFNLDASNDRGLGLTAMAERVRLCGGRFHIESKVGKGTTLRIEIPLS